VTPIHDDQLEVDIIKMMIDDKDSIPILMTRITHKDFFSKDHANNFRQCRKGFEHCGKIDVSSLKRMARYLDPTIFNSSSFSGQYADKLINLRKLRELERIKKAPCGDNANEAIERTMQGLLGLAAPTEGSKNDARSVARAMFDAWCNMEGGIMGVPSGLRAIDKGLDGYTPGHLWVIGGYTNYGKTSLISFFVFKFLEANPDKGVAFFSVEMSKTEIFEKILSQGTQRSPKQMRANPNRYVKEIEDLSSKNLMLFDDVRTQPGIYAQLMALKSQDKLPSLVVVDFVQNMKGPGEGETERVQEITKELQVMAKTLGTTVMLLSQISNEGAKSYAAGTLPYKGSSAIGQAADVGARIWRDKDEEERNPEKLATLRMLIPKNRHGRSMGLEFKLDLSTGVISE